MVGQKKKKHPLHGHSSTGEIILQYLLNLCEAGGTEPGSMLTYWQPNGVWAVTCLYNLHFGEERVGSMAMWIHLLAPGAHLAGSCSILVDPRIT